ncbi:MAG: tail fiber assembly protein [Patescibacteria group bacterium]|nr:tail fiber assembly protein [Patescibacteria group bacterium]
MKMYSPSKRTFYDPELHNNVPQDVVSVHDQEWQRLINEQGKDGKVIIPGPNGHPILGEEKRSSIMQQAHIMINRELRLRETDDLVERHRDERELGGPTTITENQFTELLRYRQLLRRLEDSQGFPFVDLPPKPAFL